VTTRNDIFDLAAAGEGRWIAAGNDRFAEHKGALFGGYVFGSAMSAVLQEPGGRGAPIAMTATFVSRVTNAPFEIVTQRLKQGNSLEFWRATVVQQREPCVEASVTLAQRTPTAAFQWLDMPIAAPPESGFGAGR
jgi:acyl-coenzyme A thioesterase PaaI-like protein